LLGLQAVGSKESKAALGRVAESNSNERIRELAYRLSLRGY